MSAWAPRPLPKPGVTIRPSVTAGLQLTGSSAYAVPPVEATRSAAAAYTTAPGNRVMLMGGSPGVEWDAGLRQVAEPDAVRQGTAAAGARRGRLEADVLPPARAGPRSEEHTSELQSQSNLVCRLLLEKKNKKNVHNDDT